MTEPALGCYVYCVLPSGEHPPLEGLAGVDPDFDLDEVTHAGLSAVVSRVRLEEFGAEALKRNLEDLAWVERTARAHDAVLARALAAQALVPFRLCTIFTDEAHVRDMLKRQRESLLEALERLRGHAEWSVKVLADRGRVEAAARERTPALAAASADAEGAASGRAFFARRKLDQALREEARAMAEAAAEEVHARLREVAAAATLLRPQHPELSGRSGEMLLNGAYLVHRGRAAEFAAITGELGERHRAIGLEVEPSGPWAPYNFVPATEASDEQ
jgi:Gas vesicle synthesis protein GvpL/GvpF